MPAPEQPANPDVGGTAAVNLQEAIWNQRYRDAGDAYLFGTAPNAFLAREAPRLLAGSRVLSVADGEGRNSVWLAGRGHRVTATEISPVALEKARRLASENHVAVDFVLADILAWTWPEAVYDAVVAIFIQFAGPQERVALFEGLKRALKPGGLLFLQGYTPKQLEYRTGGPPSEANMYTPALLEAAFGDLEILDLREYEDDLAEGAAHCGRSALIQLIARRHA